MDQLQKCMDVLPSNKGSASNSIARMHSVIKEVNLNGVNITILPALKDNYMYLVHCPTTKEAAVVDPVSPEIVMKTVESDGLDLTKVLCTHHHEDHAGGNERIMKMFQNKLIVYGGDQRIPGLTNLIGQNDRFKIGNIVVTCLTTPCHTSGHVCYYIRSPSDEMCLFTGDTLFQGGCGRFFEGTAEQMYNSLCVKLGELPDSTLVFCGHEYTLQNMFFAQHVEPDNTHVQQRIGSAKLCRITMQPTVPSTMEEEKLWNPFMRVHEPSIRKYTGQDDPIMVMDVLRKEKDKFIA